MDNLINNIVHIAGILWQFYVIGSVIFTTFFIWGLRNFTKNKNAGPESINKAHLKENAVAVYVQEVNKCFYVYEYASNNFIAQGFTKDEMWINAKKKFPTKDFVVEGPNGEAILVSNIK